MRKTPHLIKLSLLFFLLLTARGLIAQTSSVTIRVKGSKEENIPFASIRVKNRVDTLPFFTKAADSTGKAIFELATGQYTVFISAVNFQSLEKGMTVTNNQQSLQFTLEPVGKTMETVVVTAQRPLIRQEDDKTIVDPEPIAATSTSGYEILEKTPGLFVDQDGNIYISSMTPASVQINGRDMKMSAADIATMLKNLPPNSISRIEIVRTPSARYEASGSGGVVNVVLKKGVKIGMTGSVNAGFQQGKYRNQFLGFNLNNNNGKRTSYVNMNVGSRDSYEQMISDRFFAPDSVLSQDALTRYPGNNFYTAFGITWELSKKWELTYDGTVNYNNYRNNSENENIIKKISTNQEISNSLNRVSNKGSNYSAGTGFETKYKIDSSGSEWTNDFFFTHSENKSDQVFSTSYYTPVAVLTGGDGSADNKRNYFTGRSDIKLKLKDKFTFEGGLQSTIHTYHNVSNYYREIGGVRNKDVNRTNTFKYNENINSLYVQGSKTLGKDFVVKFGTRLENTNMKGRQLVPGDTSFSIQRTDLFPYVYLSKNLMKIAGYDLRAYLIYRRSIRRPFYDQLNPFRRYVDEFLTETGNPALRPQFTQNYEANISVDERPVLAIGVNDTKDIFTNVVYQADSSQSQAYRTFDNLGKNKEWYFRALGALPPGKKYFFVAGTQYNHNFYQGIYENKPLSFKRGTWSFFTYHSLKLDKKSTFSLHGFMRLKGQQQFYELSPFGALHTSINRKFLKDKLIVTISMNDIFYTNKNDFSIDQGSVNARGTRFADTRRFGINLRYNFGIRKREENNMDFNPDAGTNQRP